MPAVALFTPSVQSFYASSPVWAGVACHDTTSVLARSLGLDLPWTFCPTFGKLRPLEKPWIRPGISKPFTVTKVEIMQRRAQWMIIIAGCLFTCSIANAEGPLRKWFSGGNEIPTAGSSWMPQGQVIQGTQKAMTGARDRLAFWRKKEERRSNEFIEGTGRFFRPDLAQREENNRKPFSFVRPASWFEAEEDPGPGPSSVHDWIGQPRPGFE